MSFNPTQLLLLIYKPFDYLAHFFPELVLGVASQEVQDKARQLQGRNGATSDNVFW